MYLKCFAWKNAEGDRSKNKTYLHRILICYKFTNYKMALIYLLLGGNTGDRVKYLDMARNEIARHIGKPEAVSSLYETEPWGFDTANLFLNQLVIADTNLDPASALEKILKIELQLKRERKEKQYSSRTIDIDILFYEDRVIAEEGLIIPHPRLHERRFALEPLAEMVPEMLHPVSGKTISRLLEECKDKLQVKRL
jgi:2-amino-4-hydroxy-6-hydroxymethyldihydropteridine diphosphokinase